MIELVVIAVLAIGVLAFAALRFRGQPVWVGNFQNREGAF
jgi:hypothetical protein